MGIILFTETNGEQVYNFAEGDIELQESAFEAQTDSTGINATSDQTTLPQSYPYPYPQVCAICPPKLHS